MEGMILYVSMAWILYSYNKIDITYTKLDNLTQWLTVYSFVCSRPQVISGSHVLPTLCLHMPLSALPLAIVS